ncbi:hypothetical protein KL911_002557 [Ogataea haglerorum]|uniref:uncharacterized protein n=1 Tax=Ogataea haglerorum TaxID=1937702 RepID=UPI001C896FA1|nr:uncharacterized protein KL911_002557 [Ogataea haglerorum]KAG7754081.1 hypothetical protein KL911_002557 [Ogataea haglerorum]
MSSPSLGWERLQTVFYRSRPLFALQWEDVNLNGCMVAIGPYAAAIAVFPHMMRTAIEIYSGSGSPLTSIPWNAKAGNIVSLGWTGRCELVVVLRHGKYRVYTDYDGEFEEFVIGSEVIDVRFWNNGVVFRTIEGFKSFTYGADVADEFPTVEGSIVGWAIIPPVYHTPLKLVISTQDRLLLIDRGIQDTKRNERGPYSLISASPNGDFVALYGDQSVLIVTSDFTTTLNAFKCETGMPLQLEWCGNDAVVASYEDEMLLIGPSDESITLFLDSPAIVRPEVDGLLYLDNSSLQFVSRVSNYTVETFGIGSTSASAILLDAIEQIDQRSPKANENLEIIADKLADAVDHCIRAASEEFDPYWQKKLLRAATFGKTTLDMYNSDEFVETCNNLRVLNIIRQPEIGIFLTYSQFIELGLDRLIDLLLMRKLHYLCLKIADFMSLPKDNIYINWACAKIRNSELANDELLQELLNRLQDKTVSFAPIAQAAYNEGRADLATKLLSLETDVSLAVPMLLEMDQDSHALNKAEESLDTDSILYILVTLLNKVSVPDLLKMLNRKKNASGIFITQVASRDLQLLNDYYYKEDSIFGLTMVNLQKLAQETEIDKRKQLLNKASQTLQRSKYMKTESKWLKDEAKNLDIITPIEASLNTKTASHLELLEVLLKTDFKKAVKLQKDLKISDKQFYYKLLKTYIQLPDKRRELYDFATQKQSPIGYEPFYTESLKVGDKRHASLYLGLCTNMPYKTKIKCYLSCDDHKGAIEEAFKRKDADMIRLIKDLAGNTAHIHLADDYIERLTGRR